MISAELKAKGKYYIPFQKTLEKLEAARLAYKVLLDDRIILDMRARKILGDAEKVLKSLIAKPTAARLRELKGRMKEGKDELA